MNRTRKSFFTQLHNQQILNAAFFLLLCVFAINALAQTASVKGLVVKEGTNEAVPFANLILEGTTMGATTDIDGFYRIDNVPPGTYNLVISSLGFQRKTLFELRLTSAGTITENVELKPTSVELEAVEIYQSPFNKREESPVSMRTISATEIERNPGANRDISRVIQSLPGVASSVSFRNDIIIRGGAPSENRFYLDGIEVPNINHFATQGASGGPVGMINVALIREVDFFSGAFPANRGNTLSSVMELKQIEGNREKLSGTFMVGSSDAGILLEGPSGESSNYMLSIRRSYLQFLFSALGLPFLPTYNDLQYKHTFRFNKSSRLDIIALAALDEFALNTTVNDDETDSSLIARNNYILGNLPANEQWNYTVGGKYTKYQENGFWLFVLSRSHLNNTAIKYTDNLELDENLLLNYASEEIENKLRIERTFEYKGMRWNAGINADVPTYSNQTYNRLALPAGETIIDYNSEMTFFKYGLFFQVSGKNPSERLTYSFGTRLDANDYSATMNNPLRQFSPRFSLSYFLLPKLALNFNTGRYFQLPPYTLLGFRDNDGVLVNRRNKVTYIANNQLVLGLEFSTSASTRITLEGFGKWYENYPFLLTDSVVLANLGGDFGVIGDQPATSTSVGRSYGIELLAQQKLQKGFYGILAYTFVRSEFSDDGENYVPSAWDSRHLVSLTGGKQLKRGWEIGVRWRYTGGTPYTPFDESFSARKEVWDITMQGVLDYNRVNQLRLGSFHTLDLRIDKRWYFEKWSLNTYLDIQNLYNQMLDVQPFFSVEKDSQGQPVEDPDNPNAYLVDYIENTTGSVLPTVGIMIEW